ncbi:ATP-dependent DNA helicase Q-like 5 [Porphyridium purpureum]|uniref:DNA 3'-5' helicase n=2 Tax=Porphyridium purpureum TaxID=35688 RepID=A0A5J4YFK1_PORPP|nr:ATP-dependent DNA helicase Q-like 5 [Porphyridium purpureum]|eukprot:POR8610..scf292_37
MTRMHPRHLSRSPFIAPCASFATAKGNTLRQNICSSVRSARAIVIGTNAVASSSAVRAIMDTPLQPYNPARTLTGSALTTLGFYDTYEDMLEAYSHAIREPAEESVIYAREWCEFARRAIRLALKTTPHLLRIPVPGKQGNPSELDMHDPEVWSDGSKYRTLATLKDETLGKRIPNIARLFSFYAYWLLQMNLEDVVVKYEQTHVPSNTRPVVGALQSILNCALEQPTTSTGNTRPAAREFLRSHALQQVSDRNGEPSSIHDDMSGSQSGTCLTSRSALTISELSATQLWVLRAAWVVRLIVKEKDREIQTSNDTILSDVPCAQVLYMMHSVFRSAQEPSTYVAWKAMGNGSWMHLKTEVLVQAKVFGNLYNGSRAAARALVARVLGARDNFSVRVLSQHNTTAPMLGEIILDGSERHAAQPAELLASARRQNIDFNALSNFALLAFSAACAPPRKSSMETFVLASRSVGNSLRPVLNTRVVRVVEVVEKKLGRALATETVEHLPTEEVAEVLLIMHWIASAYIDEILGQQNQGQNVPESIDFRNFGACASRTTCAALNPEEWIAQVECAVGQFCAVPMTLRDLRNLYLHCVRDNADAFRGIAAPQGIQPVDTPAQKYKIRGAGHSLATDAAFYLASVKDEDWFAFTVECRDAWLALIGAETHASSRMGSVHPRERSLGEWASLAGLTPDTLLRDVYGSASVASPQARKQLEMLNEILMDKNVCVQYPCGSGKSASYLCMEKVVRLQGAFVLLLVPLRVSMFAALQEARSRRIEAVDLYSCTERSHGGLVVTSMDALASQRAALRRIAERIALVVVDESHVVLEHSSFRESMSVKLSASLLTKSCFVFLSATISEDAAAFVAKEFGVTIDSFLRARPLRESLNISVTEFGTSAICTQQITAAIQENALARGGRALIMCATHAEADTWFDEMRKSYSDACYKLTAREALDAEALQQARVIVGTSAVSSSLNCKSVLYCAVMRGAHSLSQVVQAWGRVGRDGEHARCEFFFDRNFQNALDQRDSPSIRQVPGFERDPWHSKAGLRRFVESALDLSSHEVHSVLNLLTTRSMVTQTANPVTVPQPSLHEMVRPSTHVVAEPSSGMIAQPTSYMLAQPSSHTVAAPSSHTVAAPSSHTVAAPSSHTVAAPSSHVMAQPTSHVPEQPTLHLLAQASSQQHEATPLASSAPARALGEQLQTIRQARATWNTAMYKCIWCSGVTCLGTCQNPNRFPNTCPYCGFRYSRSSAAAHVSCSKRSAGNIIRPRLAPNLGMCFRCLAPTEVCEKKCEKAPSALKHRMEAVYRKAFSLMGTPGSGGAEELTIFYTHKLCELVSWEGFELYKRATKLMANEWSLQKI